MFYKTLHYRLARYLELMCFKLSQLSNYVCFCYGISVHENNYDTSRRQKRFYTIWSRNTLQIFVVNPVELAKSEDCDFSCIKLALQKVSVSRKYKSNQEISTILCELVCQPSLNKLYYFHPRIIEGFLDICHFWKTEWSLQTGLQELL